MDIIGSFMAFLSSMPTLVLVALFICVVAKIFGFGMEGIVRLIIFYFFLAWFLSLFGYTLMSLESIYWYIARFVRSIF